MGMQSEIDAAMLRTKAKVIPQATWNHFRPFIEKLYVDDGLKLNEVHKVMALRHSFVAT